MIPLFLACTADKPVDSVADSGGDSSPVGDTRGDSGETGTDTVPDPVLAWEDANGWVTAEIPAGTYIMGSPYEEVGRWIPVEHGGDGTDREVQHEVTLTHAMRVSVYEATRAQFSALMGYDSSTHVPCTDECPVESLTWHEAAAFANAASDAAGLDACYTCEGKGAKVVCEPAMSPYACSGWRLPTEAEWEYFARAGQTAPFLSGGGVVEGTEEDCSPDLVLDSGELLGDEAWWCGNVTGPQVVGGRPPNAWGLLDIEGNIHEWTTDWYDITWYQEPEANVPDPEGPPTGKEKVRRGGGWGYDPWRLRLAYRGWHDPTEPSDQVGVRLMRVLGAD